jgi:hypothetical protein
VRYRGVYRRIIRKASAENPASVRGSRNPADTDETLNPLSHGRGQGFESSRLRSKNLLFYLKSALIRLVASTRSGSCITYTARRRRRRRSSRSPLLLVSNAIYIDCHVSKVSVGAMEPGLASTGCSTTTGIRRSVRSRYSSYAGSRRVSSAQSLARSAPTASMART